MLEWVELHSPLFLAGTNLGQKLDPAKRVGLKVEYDEATRHLYVTYNGKTARVPETSVLSMVEAGGQPVAAEPAAKPRPAFDPNAAQVETPMSHVFDTKKPGKTGQEFGKPK